MKLQKYVDRLNDNTLTTQEYADKKNISLRSAKKHIQLNKVKHYRLKAATLIDKKETK